MVKIHNFTLLIYIIYSTILNLCYMQIFFFAINLWGFYISWIENPLLFWQTRWCILTNCRLCWYRYRPKFYNNWLSVFLQKAQRLCQTTGTNQNFFLFVGGIFLVVIFLNFSHLSFSYLSGDGLNIFLFFVVCGALGLLLWIKSKKHKGQFSDVFTGYLGQLLGAVDK